MTTKKPRLIDPTILPLWAINRFNYDFTYNLLISEFGKAYPCDQKIDRLRCSLNQHQAVFNDLKPIFFN